MLMLSESFEAASDYDDTSDCSTQQFIAKVKAASADGDTFDYSMHQSIAKDKVPEPMDSYVSLANAAQRDADLAVLLYIQHTVVPDDESSPDNSSSIAKSISIMMLVAWNKVQDKYGNTEATTEYADTSDHNVHQFMPRISNRDRRKGPVHRYIKNDGTLIGIGGGEYVSEMPA